MKLRVIYLLGCIFSLFITDGFTAEPKPSAHNRKIVQSRRMTVKEALAFIKRIAGKDITDGRNIEDPKKINEAFDVLIADRQNIENHRELSNVDLKNILRRYRDDPNVFSDYLYTLQRDASINLSMPACSG